jgi:hypothetical protein
MTVAVILNNFKTSNPCKYVTCAMCDPAPSMPVYFSLPFPVNLQTGGFYAHYQVLSALLALACFHRKAFWVETQRRTIRNGQRFFFHELKKPAL